MKKTILIFGNYNAFSIGDIKIFKEKNDFLCIGLKTNEDLRHQKITMLDEIRYIKTDKEVRDFAQIVSYLKKWKPDFVAVISGDPAIDSMQEFNRTKLICEEHGAEMVVIKPFGTETISVYPTAIYEAIRGVGTLK